MSDQPRPSHELFHDVTDTRPRAGRAAGGTLAVSILAHALILAAVVVVPLLATDTLPTLVDSVGVFRPDELPPPDPPAPAIKRTTAAPQPNAAESRACRVSRRDRRRAAARRPSSAQTVSWMRRRTPTSSA